MIQKNRSKFGRILFPLLFSVITGALIYYGGEAYHKIGLAGLGTARVVFGYILGILQFLALAVLVQRLVHYLLLDGILASTIGTIPPRLLYQLTSFFVYLLAFAAIVGVVFKKDLTVILAASGALGIVVGMALQSLILDLFAGLAINLDRTIKIGDNIQLHRVSDQIVEGKIEEISWRTMRIVNRDNNVIILPNRLVSSSTITNFSSPSSFFEINIFITLESSIPTERAIRILNAAAVEASSIFAADTEVPSPVVGVKEIIHTPQAVKYRISVYPTFETRGKAYNLVQQFVLKHLSITGIRPTKLDQPETEHIMTLLETTGIFNDLTNDELQLIVNQANMRVIEPDISITLRGEVAISMYLIIEGLLSVKDKQRIGMKPLPPQVLGPGNLIGGTRMLMGDVYESTVMSKTNSLLFEIDHKVFEQLFLKYPQTLQVITNNTAKLISHKEKNSQWQTQEEDLKSEIYRHLQNTFTTTRR